MADTSILAAAIRSKLAAAPASSRESKVSGLPEAVRQALKPGAAIYIGRLANAGTAEILRQFSGTQAGFTIIGGSRNYTSALVHQNLVKKLIGNAFGELYPKPGPSYPIQKAYQEGRIEIESWSELTLIQRLMAGAMNMGFMVSCAGIGSSGLEENKDSVVEIADPFTPGNKLMALKALVPDLAIVHGWAADTRGNIIMGQPNLSDQDIWGALASRGGVLATVEKVVPHEFISEHSCLVDIPGFRVEFVAEVPFGAHPQAMAGWGLGKIKEFQSYDVDFGFIANYREASRKKVNLDKWLNDWVFDCRTREAYLARLRASSGLPRTGDGLDSRHRSLAALLDNPSTYSPVANSSEWMLVAGARKIREIVTGRGYKLMLAGMGRGSLAAYLAYYQMAQNTYPVRLAVGLGIFGYSPQPGSPHTSTLANIATAEMITDTLKGYGVYIGGSQNQCLSILGAGQIDRWGNINSTKMTNGAYLFGSGGAIDAASAQEVMVITRQTRERLVDRVPFVTCPGTRVRTLVTDQGIFEKPGNYESDELVLTAYIPHPEITSTDEVINSIKHSCGWELKVSPQLKKIAPPSVEELAMLRVFDPEGLFVK